MGDAPDPLAWFKSRVEALAAVISAPAPWLPTYGFSVDGGYPHVEYRDGQFHFVVVDRGRELERVSSADAEEILFQVFNFATFTMAGAYEVQHRRRGEDSRRQLFAKQLELLGQLSEKWRARAAEHQAELLSNYPFIDR